MQYFNHNFLSKLLVLIDSRYVHLRENSTEFLISCRYVFGKLFIYLIKTGVHKMGSIKGVSRGKYQTRVLLPNDNVYCSQCNKRYKRRQSLLQHIRSKHLNVRMTCMICSKEYTSRSVYNPHVKSVHGITSKLENNTFEASPDTIPSSPAQMKQLSFEADDMFPCMAKILSLKKNKIFGKHIVTNHDIDTKQVVIATTAFASIEYLICTGSGCFGCGKVPKIKIYCSNCIDVWFCSNQCKSSRPHRRKCDSIFESSDCHIVRIITRMITVALNAVSDIKALLEFCSGLLFLNKRYKNCQPPYSQYGEILKLKEQPEHVHAAIARRVVKHIMQLPQLESSKTEEMKRILFNLAYRHAISVTLNMFSETIICSKGGGYVRCSMSDILSRLNHSCDPNLNHYIDDNDVTYCVAARPIKAGEQLYINYMSEMIFESTQERKKYIKETWGFDCKCRKCCSKLDP